MESAETEPLTVSSNLRGGHHNEYVDWAFDYGVGGPYEKMFSPRNSVSGATQSIDFMTGLEHIKNVIAEAGTAGKKLRAFGSTFSINNMPYTKEYLLDSRELNYCQIGFDNDEHVASGYTATKHQLVFVQSGIMIRELSYALLDSGLCLPGSCMPDGTRFVGAVSTSSHGSQRSVGSMENYVKAIHLVIPGDNVMVQAASNQVVTAAYAQSMGNARLVNDDDLFHSALVSFGSFGVIHGMVLEAAPVFKLYYRAEMYDYETVKPVMRSLNVSSLKELDDVSDSPFHIDFVLNPFRLNQDGVLIRVQEKVLLTSAEFEQAAYRDEGAKDIPEDTDMIKQMRKFALLSTRFMFKPVTKFFLGLTVQVMVKAFVNLRLDHKTVYPHQVYTIPGAQKRRAPMYIRNYYEFEIMVPFERTIDSLDLINNFLNENPAPIVIGVRFLKKSKAKLGTSRYEMSACIVVLGFYYTWLPSFRSTDETHQMLFAAFSASDIPHTYHWGKNMPMNDQWVQKGYGEDILTWKAERKEFLGDAGLRMFTNELMDVINVTA